MSEQVLSISDAQKELTRLPDQFEQEPEAVTITRYGKPVMAILPFEAYTHLREGNKHLQETINELQEKVEALQETLEIVQDEEMMEAFREGVEDIKAGRTTSWEEVKKELGWV